MARRHKNARQPIYRKLKIQTQQINVLLCRGVYIGMEKGERVCAIAEYVPPDLTGGLQAGVGDVGNGFIPK